MVFTIAKPLEFLGHAPKHLLTIPHFFSFHEKNALEHALLAQHRVFIEIGEPEKLEALLDPLLAGTPHVLISVTTNSAYRYYIAHTITSSLNQRFGLQGYKSMQIETCLHEAILNSVIHGNLAMHSMFGSMEEMDAFYAQLQDYLAMDMYKYRRICIRAWDEAHHLKLSVSDEGAGFALIDDIAETGLPHGRGLYFIRALADHMWVGNDRRTLFMTFNY